jgi:hypothetical protein
MADEDRADLGAAQRRAKRARAETIEGMDEMFPDIRKSTDDVRDEWLRAARKMWIWVAAFAATAVAGIFMQALWMFSLIALAGAAFAWDVQNERRSTYKRMLLENKIERSILEHEKKAAAAARDGIAPS